MQTDEIEPVTNLSPDREPQLLGYQIIDSLDRECGAIKPNESDLWGDLDALVSEEEMEPLGLTYSIAKVFDNGDRTYDF